MEELALEAKFIIQLIKVEQIYTEIVYQKLTFRQSKKQRMRKFGLFLHLHYSQYGYRLYQIHQSRQSMCTFQSAHKYMFVPVAVIMAMALLVLEVLEE